MFEARAHTSWQARWRLVGSRCCLRAPSGLTLCLALRLDGPAAPAPDHCIDIDVELPIKAAVGKLPGSFLDKSSKDAEVRAAA